MPYLGLQSLGALLSLLTVSSKVSVLRFWGILSGLQLLFDL